MKRAQPEEASKSTFSTLQNISKICYLSKWIQNVPTRFRVPFHALNVKGSCFGQGSDVDLFVHLAAIPNLMVDKTTARHILVIVYDNDTTNHSVEHFKDHVRLPQHWVISHPCSCVKSCEPNYNSRKAGTLSTCLWIVSFSYNEFGDCGNTPTTWRLVRRCRTIIWWHSTDCGEHTIWLSFNSRNTFCLHFWAADI